MAIRKGISSPPTLESQQLGLDAQTSQSITATTLPSCLELRWQFHIMRKFASPVSTHGSHAFTFYGQTSAFLRSADLSSRALTLSFRAGCGEHTTRNLHWYLELRLLPGKGASLQRMYSYFLCSFTNSFSIRPALRICRSRRSLAASISRLRHSSSSCLCSVFARSNACVK